MPDALAARVIATKRYGLRPCAVITIRAVDA